MEVVRTWRDLSPPGRFLRKDEGTGLWVDIGDDDDAANTAMNKSQTMSQLIFCCVMGTMAMLSKIQLKRLAESQ